jgi:hypothetical protein
MEALRCLRRRQSDVAYRQLVADAAGQQDASPGRSAQAVRVTRCPGSKSVVAYRKPSTNSHLAAWGRREDSEIEGPD